MDDHIEEYISLDEINDYNTLSIKIMRLIIDYFDNEVEQNNYIILSSLSDIIGIILKKYSKKENYENDIFQLNEILREILYENEK